MVLHAVTSLPTPHSCCTGFPLRMSTTAPCSPIGRRTMSSLWAGKCLFAGPFCLKHPHAFERHVSSGKGGMPLLPQDSWQRPTCCSAFGKRISNMPLTPVGWTETEDAERGSPKHQRCPEEGPMMQKRRAMCAGAVKHSWCGVSHSRRASSEVSRARVMGGKGAKRSIRISPKVHVVRSVRHLLHPTGVG